MKHSDETPKARVWHLAGLGLAIFLCVVTAAVAVAKANVAAPALGDIVSFKAGTEVPRPLREAVGGRVMNASGEPGTACVLDPVAMAREGGSLVVEAVRLAGRASYIVHWAGTHTSTGDADCGATANLLLSEGDLEHLAQTAGGFGVDQNKDSRDLSAVSLPIVAN